MSDSSLPPSFDEGSATDSSTDGAAADGRFDDESLADYDALPDEDSPANGVSGVNGIGGTTGNAAGDDDSIDITESDGPNLEAGNDLDTGASGPSRP